MFIHRHSPHAAPQQHQTPASGTRLLTLMLSLLPFQPSVAAMEVHNDSPVLQNGGDEEKQVTKELEEGMKALSTNDTSTPAAPPIKPQGGTPEGSPCKSPSKKKKKFKPPSFLKKSKKQKEKVETWDGSHRHVRPCRSATGRHVWLEQSTEPRHNHSEPFQCRTPRHGILRVPLLATEFDVCGDSSSKFKELL